MSGEDTPRNALPMGAAVSPGIARLQTLHRRSLEDPEGYWQEASRPLHFATRSGPAFEATEEPPYGRWFRNWTTNLSFNCLDRWIETGRRHKVALAFEGEPGDRRN